MTQNQIRTRRYTCEDFEEEDPDDPDATYNPHAGETFEATPRTSVRQFGVLRMIREMAAKMAALEGDDDEELEALILVDDAYQDAIKMLQKRLASWTWTDGHGDPLAQPREDPTVFLDLSTVEVMYLVGKLTGSGRDDQKKADGPRRSSSRVSHDGEPGDDRVGAATAGSVG